MTIETRRHCGSNNNSISLEPPKDDTRVEIIKDRLYFETIDGTPVSDGHHFYFRTDEEFRYESFYEDFGPLNLAMLYRYCGRLQRKLKMLNLSKKRIIHYAPSNDHRQRVNAAYLIGSFAIIYLHKSAEEVWRLFESAAPYVPFRDAALGPSTYDLQLRDVFAGVEKAVKHKWLNFNDGAFNVDEYEHYEKVENGDFNWIIPGKILAFCGPHNKAGLENGYPHHSPETYFSYFRKHNVTTIVRLNKKLYDARRFANAGFQHVDLFFIDGSCPSEQIVRMFIAVVEQAPGAVAVHCKAGLGRTGTLIACWMMMKFHATAAECIAWTRICRPGSVIGPQQRFLIEKEQWCWHLSDLPSSASLSSIMAAPATTSPQHAGVTTVNGLVSQVDDIKISGSNTQVTNDVATSDSSSASTASTVASETEPPDDASKPQPVTTKSPQALESDTYTQGDQLMRIKATRGSGRNQAALIPKKNVGTGSKVVNALTAGVAKRILPSRARRASSVKEPARGMKKSGSAQETITTSTVGSGPARKAAKHQAGADASSSISSTSVTSTELIRMPRELQLHSSVHSHTYYQQRSTRPVTSVRSSAVSGGGKAIPDVSQPIKQRRLAYKSSLIPHAVSTSNRSEPEKMKKGTSVEIGSAVRSVPRSPSVVVVQSSATGQKPSASVAGISAKSSPYFLRRRSIPNMQTLLMPTAPTAVVNSSAVISAFSPDSSNFLSHLPTPHSSTSVTSAYSRRTSNIYKPGKTKRVTS